MYLSAPFISSLLAAFPFYTRYFSYFGLGIIVVALVASSFATRVWHLILTQGVMYAIGGGTCIFDLGFPSIATATVAQPNIRTTPFSQSPLLSFAPSDISYRAQSVTKEDTLIPKW